MAFPRRMRVFGVAALWPDRSTLLKDAGIAVLNGAFILSMIFVAVDDGSKDTDLVGYALGVLMAATQLLRRRWPLAALLLASLFLFTYYSANYPGISPSAVLAVPLYSAVLAGRLYWAIGITAGFFSVGYFMVVVREGGGPLDTFVDFLLQAALVFVVILLAEVLVSRRELAAETRERLRQAELEQQRESARRVAEERVRIARELHDTVAHSMATITVQAGSVLHVLGDREDNVRTALSAIRETSKEALREMRATLGVLREGPEQTPYEEAGLDRLAALIDAVRAAGVPVELEVGGEPRPLDPLVDHSAYRIVQESLTNVLRHAGPEVRATVRISYDPEGVALRVTDDGAGQAAQATDAGGHGLAGMRERTEAAGGAFTAGPGPEGGFMVTASLPTGVPSLPEAAR